MNTQNFTGININRYLMKSNEIDESTKTPVVCSEITETDNGKIIETLEMKIEDVTFGRNYLGKIEIVFYQDFITANKISRTYEFDMKNQ